MLLKDILESCSLYSCISEPRFYSALVYKFKRILENLMLVIISKIFKRFKRLDITGVCLLDFFCSVFSLCTYLCFISFLYLDLYVLGDDVRIS